MFAARRGSGPPLILVHGLGASAFSWRHTIPALATRFTTYAVDLLGFGESPAPPGFRCTMAAQAAALRQFIEARRLVRPVVVGHSMGGGVALRLAEQVPVSRLVLIAPMAYQGQQLLAWLSLGQIGPMLQAPDFDAQVVGRALAEQALRAAYAPTSPVTSLQIEGYAHGLSTREQIEAFVTHASRLDDRSTAPPDLGGITVPTLLIWGEDDPLLDLRYARMLETDLPCATLRIIECCGHMPHEEQPAETNRLIGEFLA